MTHLWWLVVVVLNLNEQIELIKWKVLYKISDLFSKRISISNNIQNVNIKAES